MATPNAGRSLAALVAGLLVVTACGGGDDEPAGPGEESSAPVTQGVTPTTEQETPTATTAAGSSSSGPSLICEDPVPTELGLGTPLDSDLDSQQCFWVEVPEGSSSVTVAVTGLTTEVRLGMYYGYVWNAQFPGAAAYWRGAGDDPSAVELSIDDPQPGPYFLFLGKGRNAVSDFTVEVTTEPAVTAEPTGATIAGPDACGGPATTLASGDTVEGEILQRSREGGDEHHVYYCVQVADGADALTIDLTDAEGYFDIQVVPPNHGGQFQYQNDRSLPDKSLTIEDPVVGAYYIDVSPALVGAAGTFEITVTVT